MSNDKVAMELDDMYDFGFSFADEAELVEPERKAVTDTMTETQKEKMIQLERLILPLLYNLMKNPEKAYIKWENRVPVIEKQIARIVAITRG